MQSASEAKEELEKLHNQLKSDHEGLVHKLQHVETQLTQEKENTSLILNSKNGRLLLGLINLPT